MMYENNSKAPVGKTECECASLILSTYSQIHQLIQRFGCVKLWSYVLRVLAGKLQTIHSIVPRHDEYVKSKLGEQKSTTIFSFDIPMILNGLFPNVFKILIICQSLT